MDEILIVDDVADNLRVLKKILNDAGYTVRVAVNGLQAVQSVLATAPELILMDINMPELNGIEACRKIKSNSEFESIPIIFISANSEVKDIVNGLEAGGVDYITKPFNQLEVLARVRTQLNLIKAQKNYIGNEVMSSIGSLVVGVSHELNTPLGNAIMANSNALESYEVLSRKYNENKVSTQDFKNYLEFTKENLTLCQNNLQATANQVQAFQTIAVDQVENKVKEVFLNEYVDKCLSVLKPKLNDASLTLESICCNNKINIDPSFLFHIISNLIENSIAHAYYNNEQHNLNLILNIEGDKLKIQYWDNGEAVSNDILKNIFKPFFTTKRGIKEHIGLSASVIYSLIVTKLNGYVDVESHQDYGLRYNISIPIT